MIAWNSQMALDAGEYLFFKEADPLRIWSVTNKEDKEFVLKLYEIEQEMNSVRAGQYIESQHVTEDEEFDPQNAETGSEWAYVETSVDQVLNQYRRVDEITHEYLETS